MIEYIYEVYMMDTEDPEFYDLPISLHRSEVNAINLCKEHNDKEKDSSFKYKYRRRILTD